ncbi:hypothetical protein GTA08_BOTSDO12914 [Neofusicoccum parvum]|nr:hypothetical protein GTA08_BOTSDO12914 [Neofusicoccum parvum]
MVREIPLSVLFTWPAPNYVNPDTRGPALLVVNAVFITLCTITLFLRLYTRIFIKRWFGSDDVFIILAYISTVGLTANVIIANTHFFWNRHVWDVPIASFPEVLKVAFSAKLIFVFAATFTRQSLLCFYYRLIADSGMVWITWALHAAVFFNTTAAVAFTCLGIWLCVPVSAYWTVSPPPGAHCLDEGKVVLGVGIVNCFIDLLITVLPIPIITRLQMPIQQRIGVMILLSLGFVVVVAGAIRTYYIWKGLIVSYDETWFTFPLWIAAAVEINLGVICACMPALRPFISRYIAPAFSTASSRISSFISHGTRSSSRNRTSKSYRKFSNTGAGNNANTENTTHSSTTLKGSKLSSKLSSRLGSKHQPNDTTTTTTASDHDELFFITSPADLNDAVRIPATYHTPSQPPSPTSSTRSNGTARRSAARTPPPHSPLKITCRQSFELVHLDRAAPASHRDRTRTPPTRLDAGGGAEQLELDPREREGRAAFGCQTEVSCPEEEGGGRETGVERKRSFVWGRF